jgi:heptose-I-phosphate ethanolaminephosphotransferase
MANRLAFRIFRKEVALIVFAAVLLALWKTCEDRINQSQVIDEASAARYSCADKELSHPVMLGSLYQSADPEQRQTTIQCEFRLSRPPSDSDGFTYPNLFQTASVNRGIRLEFGMSRRSGSAWGLAIADAGGGTVSVVLPSFPDYERWYKLNIVVEPTSVTVYSDASLLTRAEKIRLDYKMDDVMVGAGFSLSRVFVGQIRDFKIVTYDPSAARSKGSLILLVILPFGIVSLVAAALFLPANSSEVNSSKMAAYPAIPFLILGTTLCLYFRGKIVPADASDNAGLALLVLSALVPINLMGILLTKRAGTPGSVIKVTLIAFAGLVTLLLTLIGLYCDEVGLSVQARTSLLNFDEIGAIFQSNLFESLGFFVSTFSFGGLVLCMLCTVAITAGAAIILSQPFFAGKRRTAIGVCAVSVVFGLKMIESHHSLIGLIRPTLGNIAEQSKIFEAARARRAAVKAVAAPKATSGETYVVVIGEAANREHLGAYGYFRPTTPWLTSVAKNKSQWFLFQNAYSSYCHTIPSLMMALTCANQYEGGSDLDSPSIIDTAKAAGFRTYWLSEQGVSWGDNPLNALASSADYLRFVRPPGRIASLVSHTLAGLDKTRNNLVVVHLIGSHAPYTSRFPEGFDPGFLGDQKYLTSLNRSAPDFVAHYLNPYDTSIKYTDDELQQIWSALKWDEGVNAFVYFADHGEDVEGMKFHNASNFTFPMSHIPLAIGVSDAWKARYPEKLRTLAAHTGSYFTLDLFYNLFAGLAGIGAPENHARFDLSDPTYALTLANAVTMTSPKTLQAELYSKTEPKRIADDPFVITKTNVAFLVDHFGDKFIREYSDYIPTPFNAAVTGYLGVT